MKKSTIIISSIVGVLVLAGMWALGIHNTLIDLQLNADNQWSQVENVLQRRHDLIPNLVNAVKGSMKHEEKIFTALAEARQNAVNANTPEQAEQAENALNEGLKTLVTVIHEAYPELASTETVKDLMTQLEGSENRITVERKNYNDTVTAYNRMQRRFPTSIIANMGGHSEYKLFEMTEGADVVPEVNLD